MTLDTAALPADGAELIEASLDAVAASGIDIVPEFFVRFFATRPEQRDNFLICPLLGGPESLLFWPTKEFGNGQETQAGGD